MKVVLLFLAIGVAGARAQEPSSGTGGGILPAGVKTVITSQSVRVVEKGKAVEFTGAVTLTRGEDFLSADRLVTEDRNTVARAWGRVYFRRDNAQESIRWEAWGDRAVYDTALASGTLWGKPRPARARRTRAVPASEGRFDMEAPELSFARVTGSTAPGTALGIAAGRGGVYLKSVDESFPPRQTEVWAAQADYDGALDRFRLKGAFRAWPGHPAPGAPPSDLDRPFARQTQGRERRQLWGQVIDYQPDRRRLVVERAVLAHLLFDHNVGRWKEEQPKRMDTDVAPR